jgi:hypothetical protein
MKPLSFIYWSRVCLGVVAALLCAFLNVLVKDLTIFSNLSVALIVYMVTYYFYKWRFILLVEKPSKIATQGIGAYFLSWIVALGVFYTVWLSPP